MTTSELGRTTQPLLPLALAVAELRACLRDPTSVLLPDDAGYDRARLGWNRTITSSPAVIVTARCRKDVQATIRIASRRGLPLSVQSTGHGTLTSADGAVLLRLSELDDVRVQPRERLATVGPGATWQQVNAATTAHGLGSLAGRCGTVGVTGYTLGGGSGWLSRTFGYAADSVVAAEVVTADGTLVTACLHEHADLFWALRGGGGNFGVVTSLTFRLFPAREVFSGMSLYPIERARDVLAAYRDWTPQEPDQLNTAVLLIRLPPAPNVPEPLRGRRVLALRAFGLLTEATGRAALRPVLDAAGPALLDAFGVRDFAAASMATNGPDAPPMPHRQTVHLHRGLPEELLDALVEEGGADQAPYAFVELRHWGGAMARPGPHAGPAGHRDVPYSVLAVAPYLDPDHTGVDVALDRFDRRLRPFATGGSFLTLQTDPDATETAFTAANYRRLREVKRRWDPDDMFRPSHHIPLTREDHHS